MVDNYDEIIKNKVAYYKKRYGEDALETIIKDVENGTYFQSKDYIEILYKNKKEESQIIKLTGTIKEISDYIITKINANSSITLIRVIDEKYHPIEKYEKGEYL